MAKSLLIAILTAAACFGVTATTGFASHHSHARHFTVRIGDNFTIPSVDMFCAVYRSDPDRHEVGAIVSCTRDSAAGKSRATAASKYHYWISDESGNYIASRYSRAP